LFRPGQRIIINAFDSSSFPVGELLLEFAIEALEMLRPRAIHFVLEFGPNFYPGQLVHSTLKEYFQNRGVFVEFLYKGSTPDLDAYRGR